MLKRLGVFTVLLGAVLPGCDRSSDQRFIPDAAGEWDPVPGVTRLVPEVIRRIPHDESSYTQGLVFRDGKLLESTGGYGRSSLQVIDPANGAVLRKDAIPRNIFAEGLAATETALIQLTWKELVAFYYDPVTLSVVKTVPYTGEGWGLCYDGTDLYMTSGGDQLIRRHAETFELLGTVPITRAGLPLHRVNELECVGDVIWGNVYGSDHIVQIDKQTGNVIGEVDASGVFPPGVNKSSMDHVLNGIAWNGDTDTFYITGKLWPEMLEVRFVPQP